MEVKREREIMEPKTENELVVDEEKQSPVEEETTLKELLRVDEQYIPLLTLLEQFTPGEDCTLFNRKLQHFKAIVFSTCPDKTRLHQAFATFRAAALKNPVLARKLATVGAFFTQQHRQQLFIRAMLNVVLLETFSKLDLLKRSNPMFLINAANLMGDYYADANLWIGNKVHILASPLLQYMRALLESDDIRAHRSLATQLMKNGRELHFVLPKELDELSVSIQLRLLSPPPISTIWLQRSAELCRNKSLPLPNTLQQFYAAQIELPTEENSSEISYGPWKKRSKQYYYTPDNSRYRSKIGLKNNKAYTPEIIRFCKMCVAVSDWNNKYLNIWRPQEEEMTEEVEYNQTVLPPNVQAFPVPDYLPPINWFNYPENHVNYLQQGDGAYIQSQYTNMAFNQRGGDNFQYFLREYQYHPQLLDHTWQSTEWLPPQPCRCQNA